MKKKIVSLLMCGALALSLTACGSGNSDEKKDNGNLSKAKYKVGICQLVQHDALDAATDGFKDALKDKFGDDVAFDEQNAQGDSATCSTIVTGFASNKYDLILANATPALQAAVSATSDIPIVGTSITDYATALEISDWNGSTGINVTGTSDLAPLDQQEDMILELVPDVKKVGILYCSAEANSKYQAEQIEKYLDEDKVEYKEYTFTDSNDIQSVVSALAEDCDCVYIPTDNTAASNMTIVNNICQPAKLPVICGEENMMASGGLATLSISYYDIGYKAGEMAADILENGTDPASMDIAFAATTTKKYNKDYAEAIGITIPDDYEGVEAVAE
ncbi:putative ABC transport system substrate-binding protein [Lachnospiraceae bacterium RM5]|nr:putative ABC transport system substrate-binding protein [Lachnospiraceae bacterium RM5]